MRPAISSSSPIEVWLTQENMKVMCMVVREDERTEDLDVISLSMRGPSAEITGSDRRRLQA
jgi:hypothetical protein